MSELLVDPAVSRVKFEREVELYRSNSAHHRRRGTFLVRTEFPQVELAFAVPQLRPPAVLFGVRIDFTNYDLWPPSVRFVDPFSGEAWPIERTPAMPRRTSNGEPANLVQGLPGEPAFICIPGTREYHENPGHSGDSWLLHRGAGEGTLHHLIDVLHRYAVAPINGYRLSLLPQIAGVTLAEIPE